MPDDGSSYTSVPFRRVRKVLVTVADVPDSNRAADSFVASRQIIAGALAEREGSATVTANHLAFATAVIARLAHHEPPLLVAFADELKE